MTERIIRTDDQVKPKKQYNNNKRPTPPKRQSSPAELALLARKKAAQAIADECCKACANKDGEFTGKCRDCYSIYNDTTSRYWLARYKCLTNYVKEPVPESETINITVE